MLTNYRMFTFLARFLNTSTYSTNCTQTHTKHATPSWQTALKHIPANCTQTYTKHVWYMFECSLPRRCCMFGMCLSAVCTICTGIQEPSQKCEHAIVR